MDAMWKVIQHGLWWTILNGHVATQKGLVCIMSTLQIQRGLEHQRPQLFGTGIVFETLVFVLNCHCHWINRHSKDDITPWLRYWLIQIKVCTERDQEVIDRSKCTLTSFRSCLIFLSTNIPCLLLPILIRYFQNILFTIMQPYT